jgi:hypothetical protein
MNKKLVMMMMVMQRHNTCCGGLDGVLLPESTMDSRWPVPTRVCRDGLPRLHARRSSRPRGSHWPAPTEARRGGLPRLHTYTSTRPIILLVLLLLVLVHWHTSPRPRDSSWRAPTGARKRRTRKLGPGTWYLVLGTNILTWHTHSHNMRIANHSAAFM